MHFDCAVILTVANEGKFSVRRIASGEFCSPRQFPSIPLPLPCVPCPKSVQPLTFQQPARQQAVRHMIEYGP